MTTLFAHQQGPGLHSRENTGVGERDDACMTRAEDGMVMAMVIVSVEAVNVLRNGGRRDEKSF